MAKMFGTSDQSIIAVSGESIPFDDYYEGVGRSPLIRWIDRAKAAVIRDALRALRPGARVLDNACGAAAITSSLRDRGLRVFGHDGNPVLARAAAARGVVVTLGRLDALPYRANSFDAVVMIDSLEHVPSREKTMAAVKRILKPDGTFIVLTPPYDSFSWLLGEHFIYVVTGRTCVAHISPFTAESLTWYLKSNFREFRIGRANFGLTMFGVARHKT